MAAVTLEQRVHKLEREIQELKEMLMQSPRGKKTKTGGFSSLRGVLDPKYDLSLKQIQAFKYKPKGI